MFIVRKASGNLAMGRKFQKWCTKSNQHPNIRVGLSYPAFSYLFAVEKQSSDPITNHGGVCLALHFKSFLVGTGHWRRQRNCDGSRVIKNLKYTYRALDSPRSLVQLSAYHCQTTSLAHKDFEFLGNVFQSTNHKDSSNNHVGQ